MITTCIVCKNNFETIISEAVYCGDTCAYRGEILMDKSSMKSLSLDDLEEEIDRLYPHRCQWCGGSGCVDQIKTDPCPECQQVGLDPLNTNLRLEEGGESPTIGHSLLSETRPWLHIDEVNLRMEIHSESLRSMWSSSTDEDEDEEI